MLTVRERKMGKKKEENNGATDQLSRRMSGMDTLPLDHTQLGLVQLAPDCGLAKS